MSNDKDLNELNDYLYRIDKRVASANENGLFRSDKEAFTRILSKLEEVRMQVKSPKQATAMQLASCYTKLALVLDDLFSVMKAAKFSWRFINLYAAHIWIYNIVFLSFVFLFYFTNSNVIVSTKINVDLTGINAAAWGVIGGLLRGLWWVWYNVNRGTYRHVWNIWFISSPFLGGILGAIVYLISIAGLAFISGTKSSAINPPVIMFFAAFAGYNWDWAIEQFKRVARSEKK